MGVGYCVLVVVAGFMVYMGFVGIQLACKWGDDRHRACILQKKFNECEKISGGRPVKLLRLMLYEWTKEEINHNANCVITTHDGTEKLLPICLSGGVIPKVGEMYILSADIFNSWFPKFVLEKHP